MLQLSILLFLAENKPLLRLFADIKRNEILQDTSADELDKFLEFLMLVDKHLA